MTILVALLVGLLAGRVVWLLSRRIFDSPVFARTNYRGIALPTGTGVAIALTVIVVESVRILAGRTGWGAQLPTPPRAAVIFVVVAFALLGLLDDVAGGNDARGFRGHIGALLSGRLTTGSIKLFGGAACAIIAVGAVTRGSTGQLLIDSALVALSANLANLFDRAPGRAIKAAGIGFVLLVIGTGFTDAIVPVAVTIGAAGALFLDDSKERIMLGDAGANALGAAIGLGVVLACAPATRTAVLIAVLALNLLSEVVSFSRIIDSVTPSRKPDHVS